jgi:hypothetical protein
METPKAAHPRPQGCTDKAVVQTLLPKRSPRKSSGALGLGYDVLLAGGNVAVDFGADADFGHDGFMPHIMFLHVL